MPYRWTIACILMAAFTVRPALADDHRSDENIVSWAKGTLQYRKISTKQVTGSEEFRLTVHPDGRRTVQTTNRLKTIGVRRDVVMRIAPDFKPEEVFASYWAQGQWRGSGLFTLNGQTMTAFVNTPLGTINQTIEVPESFSFVPHPLTSNAFHHWAYDHEKGGKQTVTLYDMPSRGLPSASLIGSMYESTIEFVGPRTIETAAGEFETELWRYSDDFEMYVTREHSMLIKGIWKEADSEYVLVKLETGR